MILSKKLKIDSDKMISLVDFPPTIAALAGAEKAENWKGLNFLQDDREMVYFENYHTKTRWVLDEFAEDQTKYFFRGVRTKEFKYVQDDLSGELLFDLNKDPKKMSWEEQK